MANTSPTTQSHVNNSTPTFFLQEDAAFCYYNRNIAIDVALAVVIHEGNGNVRINDALSQRDAEDAWRFGFCTS